MPRNAALHPLSHDHHHSLVLALRLKKGGPTSAHDRGWPSDPKGHAARTIEYARQEILPHFAIEESILFPAAQAIEHCRRTAERLVDEHNEMRQMIESIETALSENNRDISTELRAFGELLERHIRSEEREFFPAMEVALSEATLAEIGAKIALAHKG